MIDGWELYPDEVCQPEGFAQSTAPKPRDTFIGQYSDFSYPKNGHSAFGKATYRLTLDYRGQENGVSLERPETFTDYALFINGRKAAWRGSGATVDFVPDGSAERMLPVENHTHYYSGFIILPRRVRPVR